MDPSLFELPSMNKKKPKNTSRRITPWTEENKWTESASGYFIDVVTERDYSHRHKSIDETGEVDFLNTKEPRACPHCGSIWITRQGYGTM